MYKDSRKDHDNAPTENPACTLNMALLSTMLTVAHMITWTRRHDT